MVKLRPSCVLFGFRLTQNPLVNSPNIDKQLLFPIGSPNCTLSTFPGGGLVVGKCVTKENPKSDLDLGLRVCQYKQNVFLLRCKAYLLTTYTSVLVSI